MRRLRALTLPSWSLPLMVAAIVITPFAGFALAGPPLGLALGALTATAVIALAARARFDEPIEVASGAADRFRVLVVVLAPLEDPALVETVVALAREGASALRLDGREPEALVLAPARPGRVAHWLSDLGDARFDAQRHLALSLGALAVAGLDARGRVGDGDPVQAVEDVLREFPAHEVVFVGAEGIGREVGEVRRRLDRPVRTLSSS